ncbi:MAG: hypothetical protein S0880_09185 [Actinomycetota bacterium]|nr:hypothetical protein [Actinomycetota bacterium]
MLTTLAILAIVVLASTAAMIGVPIWMMRRRMRVVPGVRTRAPLRWAVVPSRPARLQRRLRSAVLLSSVDSARADGAFAELVLDIRREAIQLDEALAVAGRASGPLRRAALGDLSPRVARLEDAARRVANLAPASPPDDAGVDTLARLEHRLDMVESALREIDELDQRSTGTPTERSRPPIWL